MSGIVISVINNKGGTSKTVTSVSLAHALAKDNKKVLVIDNDSQANATTTLLKGEEFKTSIYDIYSSDSEIDPQNYIYWTSFQANLHCLPNDPLTATVEPDLIKRGINGFDVLRKKLRNYIVENYDFCIIDNPPNMGTFVINSLYTSDFAIVPTDAGSKASITGLIKAVHFIDDIKKIANPDLKFLRVLLTKMDRRTSVSQVITSQLKENFGESKMFKTVIPLNTTIQKAELMDFTIFKLSTISRGAKAYKELAKELLEILSNE